MKASFIKNKKVRYGSLSLALTAFIIAVVVIFNVIFSSLARKNLWYIDMTADDRYTLSDAGISYLTSALEKANKDRTEKGQPEAKVKILFCDDPDKFEDGVFQKMVYNTALQLQKQFRDTIEVDWVNIVRNPSAVHNYGNPKTTSVIVISGSEYRTLSLRNFFVFNSEDDTTPWAQKMERTFAVAIAGVTQAESPVCAMTNNHGEQVTDTEFLTLLSDAGYKMTTIDLTKDDIPADCRLMITFNPKSDFLTDKDGVSGISETTRLDKFLDEANSYMIFTNADTPELPNLEEYLAEWGIKYQRVSDESGLSGENAKFNYMIKDSTQAIQDPYTFIGTYETRGYGASVTKNMRSGGVPKKVIFKNATAITNSEYFKPTIYHDENAESSDISEDYLYYSYYMNGVARSMYSIFTTSDGGEAMANGKLVAKSDNSLSASSAEAGSTGTGASGTGESGSGENIGVAKERLMLMTISRESRTIQDDNYHSQSNDSYVLACTSTDFATEKFLQSAVYGNSDLLLSTLRTVGREVVPVGLTLVPFAESSISSITTKQATQYTVVLTIVPAVIMFGLGLYVIVRRKYS